MMRATVQELFTPGRATVQISLRECSNHLHTRPEMRRDGANGLYRWPRFGVLHGANGLHVLSYHA
jgi:hypothetical protein